MGGNGEITAGIGGQSERGGIFCGVPQGQHGVVLGGGDQDGARHGRGACGTACEGVIQLLVVQGQHQLSCLGNACLVQDQIGACFRQQEDGVLHSADVRVGDDAVAGEGHVLTGRNGQGVVVGHDGVEIRVGDGAAGFPCGSLGTDRAGFPLGALGTNGALNALRALDALFTLGACGTLNALFTLGACGALNALFTLGACGALDALFPLRACGALLALFALGALGALLALFALRACGALLALFTLRACGALDALLALGALRAYCAGFPLGALGTNGALNALRALDALFPLRPCGALLSLRALGASGAGDAEAGLASAPAIAIFLLRRAGGRVTATAGISLKRILSVQKNAS